MYYKFILIKGSLLNTLSCSHNDFISTESDEPDPRVVPRIPRDDDGFLD